MNAPASGAKSFIVARAIRLRALQRKNLARFLFDQLGGNGRLRPLGVAFAPFFARNARSSGIDSITWFFPSTARGRKTREAA
ncbi:MAG: hypothetical protein ACREDT_07545 [Methylocella sp.]